MSKTIQVVDLSEGGERVFFEVGHGEGIETVIRELVALMDGRGDVTVRVREEEASDE